MSTLFYDEDSTSYEPRFSISTQYFVQFVSDDITVFNSFRDTDDVKQIEASINDLVAFITPIPFTHQIVLSAVIAFLTVFLNSLVCKHYLNSKECTRPYILALVCIDLALVFSTLVSNVLLHLVTHNEKLLEAIFIFSQTTFGLGFGLYLYPSLFLAVDRFVVVLFPLKYREMTGQIRCFKGVLLGIHATDIIADVIVSMLFGTFSLPSVITIFISMLLIIFVLLSITVLYSTMVGMIIKTSRQMAPALQRGVMDPSRVLHQRPARPALN